MLRTRTWLISFGLNLNPVELLHIVAEVNTVEIAHHSLEDLVASIYIESELLITYFFLNAHAAL